MRIILKSVLWVAVIQFMACINLLHAETTLKNSSVMNAWGNPRVITSAWDRGKGHDSVTMMPDSTFWLMPKKRAANANDEAIVMVYMARLLNAHGGYFCATQLRSRNKGGGCPKIWTQYQNPHGDFERTCFWLCEPGYSGENCAQRGGTGTSCAYTKLDKQTLSVNVQYNEEGGWDAGTIEDALKSNNAMFVYDANREKKSREADVILLASEYLANGHGIVASPATFTAHGGMWNADNYSDEWTDCKHGDSNLTVTAHGGNYQTKILCMPGFDGAGCTNTRCRACDEPTAKYNENTGMCSDCIEHHIKNADGKCVECPAGTVAVSDKNICLKCENTEYVKDGKCAPRVQIAKSALYNCAPNEDTGDFKACVKSDCVNGTRVKCLTEQRQIGVKECSGGKWGNCVK